MDKINLVDFIRLSVEMSSAGHRKVFFKSAVRKSATEFQFS